MITLLTGQPGHGKTLRALQLALELKGQGREVFACRVTGLDDQRTGFHVLDQMADWQSLPDGSVVLVDECYEDIPARGPSKPIPEWVQKLATHRHRGFDFILICQLGTQIDAFVRGLVDKHVHVRRKFGFAKSVLLEWDRYVGNPSSNAELKNARKKAWSYPSKVFELYRSATMHTVQKSIPWQFVGIPVLVILVAGAIWWAFDRFKSRGETRQQTEQERQAGDKGALAPSSPPASTQVTIKKPATPAEYVERFVPRLSGMPWSAPAFDDRAPRSNPEIYCVSMDTGRCICHSEQGTRIRVEALVCAEIAVYGIYNPFREPLVSHGRPQYEAERSTPKGGSSEPPARPLESLPGITARNMRKDPLQTFPALAR